MQRGVLGRQNVTYRGSPRWEERKGQLGWGVPSGAGGEKRGQAGRQSRA